jgi:hypothetical protein
MLDYREYRSSEWKVRFGSCPDGLTPCLLCGKPVKTPRYWLHEHEGGGVVVTEAEAATLDEQSDMGMWPIGADCLKKHPDLRPYIQK